MGYDVPEDEIEHYAFMLDAEFRKNAFCSHMEPYFAEMDAVFATVMVGYSRNPLFSIYSMAREWCMAMHLKKMHPEMFRRFGYRYQCINYQFTGEERLRRLVDFKDKYQHTFKNIGILRAIHSSVFAYAYIYLKAVLTKEVITAENFIMDSSSSKVTLLLQGESITNFDFPVTKYVHRSAQPLRKALRGIRCCAVFHRITHLPLQDALRTKNCQKLTPA